MQAGWLAGRSAERQTGRQTGRQTDRQMNGWPFIPRLVCNECLNRKSDNSIYERIFLLLEDTKNIFLSASRSQAVEKGPVKLLMWSAVAQLEEC